MLMILDCSFLESAYLLIYGELPSARQYRTFESEVMNHTTVHRDMESMVSSFRFDAHPMAILTSSSVLHLHSRDYMLILSAIQLRRSWCVRPRGKFYPTLSISICIDVSRRPIPRFKDRRSTPTPRKEIPLLSN